MKNMYTHEEPYDNKTARHCSEKGAEKLPKIEDYSQRHPRDATKENVDFSKSAQESEQQQHTLGKELKRKENIVDLGHQKPRARKAENVLSKLKRQRKGKAKELDQDAQLNETIPQKENAPARQGEVHQEKKIVLRVSAAKEDIAVMIESVITGIPRIANISKDK